MNTLAISRATTRRKEQGSLQSSSQNLRWFECVCAGATFWIRARNMGVAWLIVMDRYGVNHPDQIPEPRRLIPIEMAEETNVADGSVESVIDDYPTRPVSRTKILSLLK